MLMVNAFAFLRFTTMGKCLNEKQAWVLNSYATHFPQFFLGWLPGHLDLKPFGQWLVKMYHTFYHFLFCRNRTLFHGSGVTILRNTALFCSFSIYRAVDARCWHWSRKQATASLTIPSKTYLFLHSCRLDLWEFPRFWTSGLKPHKTTICSFRTIFMAWQHKSIFTGICTVLWSQVCIVFYSGVSKGPFRANAPSRQVNIHTPWLATNAAWF